MESPFQFSSEVYHSNPSFGPLSIHCVGPWGYNKQKQGPCPQKSYGLLETDIHQ